MMSVFFQCHCFGTERRGFEGFESFERFEGTGEGQAQINHNWAGAWGLQIPINCGLIPTMLYCFLKWSNELIDCVSVC